MARIRVLDKGVADLIAAGEVVVSPASAVKEMIENSVDAGAKNIRVSARNAGKTFLRVTDDGEGIDSRDVQAAFMRSATSKLADDDMSAISTLGFRGEALASIAAVARVEMLTKTRDDVLATRAIVQDGHFESAPVSAREGTEITVRDLFRNVPARLKSLRSDRQENADIFDVVCCAAISRPDISFRLELDGREALATDGGGDLAKLASVALGDSFIASALKVSYENDPLSVTGFIASPGAARRSSERYYALNGRVIKSPGIDAALDAAYTELTGLKGTQALLCVRLPFRMVDVNVHPAKLTVRFRNETLVMMLIKEAVKSALSASFIPVLPASAGIEAFEAPEPSRRLVFDADAVFPTRAQEPELLLSQGSGTRKIRDAIEPRGSEAAYGPAETPEETPGIPDPDQMAGQPEGTAAVTPSGVEEDDGTMSRTLIRKLASMPHLGNAFGLFAMIQAGGHVWIVDTHAAHERVLYEKYSACFSEGNVGTARFMIPFEVDVPAGEAELFENSASLLGELGFDLRRVSSNRIALLGAPSCLGEFDAADLVAGLCEGLKAGGLEGAARRDAIIRKACHDAVRGESQLSGAQLSMLLTDLAETQNPFTCPHGRPVFASLSRRYFLKAFGRV